MIFEKVVRWVINTYLSQFIENVNYSDINVGLLNGKISLTNVKVKNDAIEKFVSGLKVSRAIVNKIDISIPWTSGLFIPPTTILVDGLYIVVAPPNETTISNDEEMAWQQKLKKIDFLEAARKLRETSVENEESKKTKSITEKLGVTIIKNLQFTITNIHIRYENMPNSMGVFIQSLQFQTTNKYWNVDDEENENSSNTESAEEDVDYKLIILKDFGIYSCKNKINLTEKTLTEFKDYLSVEGFIKRCHDRQNCILKPVTLVLRSKINMNPENHNFSMSKFVFDLVFGEISIRISKYNAKFVLNELKAISMRKRYNKYNHLRPKIQISKAPKEWFKFAVNCYLENIRKHNNQWDMTNIFNYRKYFKLYIQVYKDKLCNINKDDKSTTEQNEILMDCEKLLSVFSIMLGRKLAEIEAKKTGLYPPKESSGWIPSWMKWGTGKSTEETNLSKEIEGGFTEEEKNKMYSAIGYVDSTLDDSIYPENYSIIVFKCVLSRFQLKLEDNLRNQVLEGIVDKFSFLISMRDKGFTFTVNTDYFAVFGAYPVPHKYKTTSDASTISSLSQKESVVAPKIIFLRKRENILNLKISKNPVDVSADYAIEMISEGMDVIYDSHTANRMVEWFSELNVDDVSNKVALAASTTLNIYRDRFNLHQILDNSIYVDLKFLVKSSRFIIPENGVYLNENSFFSLNFGDFNVVSHKTQRDDFNFNNVPISEMMDRVYDKFDIHLIDFGLGLNMPDGEIINLVEPIKFDLNLSKSIIPALFELPAMKMEAFLSKLDFKVKVDELQRIVKIILSIPAISFPTKDEKPLVSIVEQVKLVKDVDSRTEAINEISEMDDFISAKTSFDESDGGSIEENMDDVTQFKIAFTVDAINLTVIDTTASKSTMVAINLKKIGISVNINKYSKKMHLFVESVNASYENDNLGKVQNLIDTKETEKLISISVSQFDKNYISKRDEFAIKAKIDCDYLKICIYQPAVIFLKETCLNMYETILTNNNSNAFTTQYHEYRQSVNMYAISRSESGFTNYLKTFSQMPEFDQDSTMENTKNVDLDINVSQICIEFMDIVCLNLTGFSMDVKLLRNDSEIGVTLENLEILNIEQDAVYKNIFIVNKKLEKTENLLNLHVKSFTVRPIEEKFDVIIDLKCLQVEFVFISVFLKKIANKCEIFAIKKESIDTLTQSISKSAKSAVDTASNLLIGFNIQVISPKLILPTNSESIQVLYANLGSLKISNEYSIGIPLIDDILISMDNISLYSLKYTDRINNNFNKHVIIEPIHVDLNLQRNVQFNMDKSQPMINAFMDVNECNFKISYLDLKYILAIWYENINEVYENVSTKTEKVEKVKKVSFKDQENIETNNVQVKYKGKKVKKKSNDKPKIVEISFKFHLKTLQLILLDDTIIVKNEVSDENLRNNFRNIALVEIENLSLDLKILTNEDLSVEISLKNITLQDLRPERSVIHQIFERSNCYDCDKIIKATYTKEEGSQTPLLFVSIEKIVVCIWLEYLMELKDFFLKAFKREKPKKKHSKKQLQVEQVPETLSLNSDSSFEYVEETMEVVIVFSDPEFIMVDDRSNLNSRCFIAKSNLMVKCQLSDDVTLAFVELNNLEIFCSTFHLESRDKFKVKILNKTNMTVRYDINNLNSDVDASINAELFQFYMCPSTINLFFSILKNLSIKEDDSKHEEAFDFNKFWEIDKIVNQNFEFMKYALPVDVGSEGTSLSDVTEFFNNEKMNVVIENFIIHISDTQNSENNFIIEGGVSGIVESWSHNLVANLNTTIEVGYYNDRLAVWEPLLEPINQKSGVNKDAYRSFNLSIFYETNDLVEELDEDFRIPPPFNHVKVTSIDQLNLTLTKRAMHMLHRVATLFNDAYQLKENDCTHNKTDNNKMPFFIENISGLNITVKLDKNLEFSENSKCTSKLINTGNCAYFSYKEKSKIINNKFLDHGYLESTAQMEIGFSTNKIKINAIKYDLYPVAVNSNTMVVIDVNCCNDRQNIIIRSMYQVRNLLPYALAIKCFSKSVNNGKLIDIGSCQKNETLCIPVQHTLADTKMIISIENYVSEEIGNVFETNFKSTIKFTNSDGECRYIDSYLKKKIISLNDKSKDKTMYYLMFTPIMTFTNLLPFSIVFKNKEIVDEFMIKSGNCEIFDTLKNNSGSITVQFSYSNNDWSCVFNLVENEKFKKLTFTSSDQMEKLNLNLEIDNEDGYYCVKIYSYYWLINKTSRNLVYKNNENLIISHPTGNESIVLMNRTNRVSLSIENSSWSKHFSLDAVGTLGLINCKKNNEEEEDAHKHKRGKLNCFSCCTKLQSISTKVSVSITLANFGLTRIITFSPFCFVSNLTWFKLKILQCKNIENSDPLILDPGKSKPLIIDSSGEELSFIVVALGENNTKKSMSVPFFPSKSSITTLFLQDPFVGVSVETNITESKLIMKFHNLDKHSAQWIILNDYKMETVKFYQKNSIEKIYLLKPNTYQRYTWQNHKEQYELICSIESQKDITINVKAQDDSDSFIIKKDGVDVSYYWISFLNGQQRVLLFTQSDRLAFYTKQVVELEQNDWQYTIGLKNIGLSIVDEIVKQEIAFISITGPGAIWSHEQNNKYVDFDVGMSRIIELNFLKSLQIEPKIFKCGKYTINFLKTGPIILYPKPQNLKRTMKYGLWLDYSTSEFKTYIHTKLNKLQIDNQLKSAMYTVALGSIQRHSTENKPFAEASVMMRTILNSNIIQFKYFKVLIQEIITQIDQNFINTLLSFFVDKYSDINDDLKIKNVKIENFEQNLDMTDYSLNEFSQSRDDEKRNFFDNLHISPLKIQLTFTLSSRLGTSDNTILLFLKNIGFLLTDIRDVCFKLGYFERNGEFYTTSTLLSEIQTHYYQQAIKEAYALVLGLDVLGNPYGVLTGFATGIEDLFYEPYKGAIEGPQEFFTGVATGLRSFFGHTIGGAAGAFSRIAGTFGKGISVLSFDKKHQKLRRKRMNKTPDDFGEGIRSGGKHLIRGIFDGVTGIITQPIEGAKDEGAGGFFKGLGVGLVGVVTRPVGGVVDFASSTLDGIKSSTECKKALKRIRPPRYMGENFVVRPYNLYKALGVSVIQDVDNGKYSTTDTYVAHTYTSNCKKHMLVATNKRILYIKTDSLMKNWVSMFTYNWSTITSEPKLTGDKIYIQCNIKKLFGRVDHGKKFTIINTQEAKEFTQATKLFYQSYTN